MENMHDFISCFVYEVVKEHDWTMPKYNSEEYSSYTEYECECLDVGHEYEYDVAEMAIERMIKTGGITQEQIEKLGDKITDIVWDMIASAILENMSEEV